MGMMVEQEDLIRRRLIYCGHLIRHNSLEHDMMVGKVEGQRGRGRRRIRWMDGVTGPLEMDLGAVARLARDRVDWRRTVHRVTQSRHRLNGA